MEVSGVMFGSQHYSKYIICSADEKVIGLERHDGEQTITLRYSHNNHALCLNNVIAFCKSKSELFTLSFTFFICLGKVWKVQWGMRSH